LPLNSKVSKASKTFEGASGGPWIFEASKVEDRPSAIEEDPSTVFDAFESFELKI